VLYEEDSLLGFHTNVDAVCRSYSENCFEESRGVCAKDAHSFEIVFLEVICKASRTVCHFLICPPHDLVVCGLVVYCYCLSSSLSAFVPLKAGLCRFGRMANIGLNCSCAWEEPGRRKAVDVMPMAIRRFFGNGR